MSISTALDKLEVRARELMALYSAALDERDRLRTTNADLLAACEAVLDAIQATDLNGAVLWIRPPYQADGVHETATDRLQAAIAKAKGA